MFLEFFAWDEKWKPPIKNLFEEETTCNLNEFLGPFIYWNDRILLSFPS